jgi:hypothetical protein
MAGNDEDAAAAMAEITRKLFDAATADRSRLVANDPTPGTIVQTREQPPAGEDHREGARLA